ncbi:MAG: 4-amino-4-deoxy-L-arabinose transferase-like glycosyltransferase [Rhodoferax sp.]
MNQTTPAIVAQGAVKRLPRLALILFCMAYVLPGFIGRVPWKSADMTAFGYMAELARGGTSWLTPQLMGFLPDGGALLPYWLGAWAIQLAPAGIAADLAARTPFILLLTLTLFAIWYGTYSLARSPEAQPVSFAFGGEARPADYARALADGGLLAFIACLGLAQLSHETTPALAQLCFTALSFYAFAALLQHKVLPTIAAVLGLTGLALSGAPTLAILLGAGSAIIHLLDRSTAKEFAWRKTWRAGGLVMLTLAVAGLAWQLDLWRWRIELPHANWLEWRNLGRLLLWFTWPTWPLALWTVWRWRHQLFRWSPPSLHLALPLWFTAVALGATFTTTAADRSLLLALPALAALAAFALPTLERSVAALIDWFTLVFFSGCAFIIWVIWIAMQTGVPQQPAANVAKLAPGFEHSFSAPSFVIAISATLAWTWLVKWRVGRHRAAIWKTLVLPAGGAALCWLLLMTLWLPLLDFARSYAPLVRRSMVIMQQQPSCVEVHGLSAGQIAAFQFHGKLLMQRAERSASCPWLIVDRDALPSLPNIVDMRQWARPSNMRHPSDRDEDLLIYQRKLPGKS